MASAVRLCAVDIGGPQLPNGNLYQLIMRVRRRHINEVRELAV